MARPDATLRTGGPDDHDALGALMFDAVRTGDSPYSAAQRAAWVPAPRRGADWDARLSGQHIVVAQGADSVPVGFMTLAVAPGQTRTADGARPEPPAPSDAALGSRLRGSTGGDGYIDFAYIRPAARGGGLFARMLDAIEAEARRRGIGRLWVHASLMAEPAFARCGFCVVRRESVTIGDQSLDRCEMEKSLAD